MINFCQTLANPIVIQVIQAIHRIAYEIKAKKEKGETVTVFLCDPVKDFPDLAAIQFTQIKDYVFSFQSNGELFIFTHRPLVSRLFIWASVPEDLEVMSNYPENSDLVNQTEVTIGGKYPRIVKTGNYIHPSKNPSGLVKTVEFSLKPKGMVCTIASGRHALGKTVCPVTMLENISQYELINHGMATLDKIRSGYDILLKAMSSLKTPVSH